jgi:hypothetical protein
MLRVPKVILAHDSATQYGGAERVVDQMVKIYPNSPVYTLVYNHKLSQLFKNWKIVTSPLQIVYEIFPRFQILFPLIPLVLAFWRTEQVLVSSKIFTSQKGLFTLTIAIRQLDFYISTLAMLIARCQKWSNPLQNAFYSY